MRLNEFNIYEMTFDIDFKSMSILVVPEQLKGVGKVTIPVWTGNFFINDIRHYRIPTAR